MSANKEIAELTRSVQEHTDKTQGFLDEADERITAKEQQVDNFIIEATPEKRYVQEITIGGSTDYLYPVFWTFPNNSFGVSKLEIHRSYSWNKGTLHDTHVAGLLLQLEGNGNPWHGDANYLKVIKYAASYNNTVSHLQFAGFASRESNDGNPVSYASDGINFTHSGVYLRGGLTYRLSSNFPFKPLRLADENDVNSKRVIHSYLNVDFVVKPIPFSQLISPVEDE